MQHHHLGRRGAVALALVLALVGLMSSPASAATASMSFGPFTIGTETYEVGGPDECTVPLPTQAINVSFTGNASSGTWTASGSFKVRFRLAPPNDLQYWQADVTLLTATGAYSGAVPNYTLASSLSNHITLEWKLYRLTPPTCAKDDLACTLRNRVVLTAGSGFTGTLPTPIPGDTMKWIGTSNTAGGVAMTVVGLNCPATIRSQWAGKHLTFPGPGGLAFTF